ncbi:MAG: metallophosphoesterase [Chitinispirillaceae bacterium]
MKKSEAIHLIHISDTHIGSTPDFILREKNTYDCTRALINKITSFEAPVDFILHTGDVVNRPEEAAYDLTRQVFCDLKSPVVYVPGNHDEPEMVNRLHDKLPWLKPLRQNSGSSEFEMKGCKFLVLDCKGSAEIDPHGIFEDAHKKVLNDFLNRGESVSSVILLHFPPVPLDVPWIDEDMLIIHGEELHRTFVESRNRIAAVLFGHVHRRFTLVRDSILYSSAPSPFCQFSASPVDEKVKFETDIPVSFNYVTIENGNVSVMEVT